MAENAVAEIGLIEQAQRTCHCQVVPAPNRLKGILVEPTSNPMRLRVGEGPGGVRRVAFTWQATDSATGVQDKLTELAPMEEAGFCGGVAVEQVAGVPIVTQ